MTARILVLDDEPNVRLAIRRILSPRGYEIVEASDAREARVALGRDGIDLALLDVVLPGASGTLFLAWMAMEHPEVPAVMVTGVDDPEVGQKAIELGAYGYVLKPIVREQLVVTVASALRRRELERGQRGRSQRLSTNLDAAEEHLSTARAALDEGATTVARGQLDAALESIRRARRPEGG